MVKKGTEDVNGLCIPEEEAVDLATLTADLIDTMKGQAKRLKEQGYDTGKIEKQIKGMKRHLTVARRLVKG